MSGESRAEEMLMMTGIELFQMYDLWTPVEGLKLEGRRMVMVFWDGIETAYGAGRMIGVGHRRMGYRHCIAWSLG